MRLLTVRAKCADWRREKAGPRIGKNDFDINLNNCRNIVRVDGDSLLIKKNALNVFYGKNGTGKTTLSRALDYICDGSDEKKAALSSYRYLNSGSAVDAPSATCKTRIKSLLVFNDDWVDAHCFNASTVHSNTFELYVRDSDVKKLEKQRHSKMNRLYLALRSEEVEELRNTLLTLQKGLGKIKGNGEFAANATTVKAFKEGVPTEVIPKCLSQVTSRMTASEKAKWLDWHTKHPATHDKSVCPYCGTKDFGRMEACAEYDSSRDKTAVKQWSQMAAAFDSVGPILSRKNRALMGKVLRSKDAPVADEIESLAALSADVAQALYAIDELNQALNDEECADVKILTSRLNDHAKVLADCDIFLKTQGGNKTTVSEAISRITSAVKGVVSAQAELEDISSSLVRRISSNISGHESEINEFLCQCGYEYEIKIESNPQISEAKMLLVPSSSCCVVDNPKTALSYGERNALALVLFMFEALHEQNPLIVLDDPISSFDYDKRYGVLYALFASDGLFSKNLFGKSVLVMTHDFLVVSDLIKIPGKGISAAKGQFLSCDADGVLRSVPLDEDAIVPYTQLLRNQIAAMGSGPRILQLIYVRNLCEMLRQSRSDRKTRFGWTFRLLSDLIHGRSSQEILADKRLDGRGCRQVAMCENCVKKLTGKAFDFWEAVDSYSDCSAMLVDMYESQPLSSIDKLHVVRLLIERDSTLVEEKKIMKRFADESCHIGGSYLYQLDGHIYDQVPFYVVEWCDEVVAKAKGKLACA